MPGLGGLVSRAKPSNPKLMPMMMVIMMMIMFMVTMMVVMMMLAVVAKTYAIIKAPTVTLAAAVAVSEA